MGRVLQEDSYYGSKYYKYDLGGNLKSYKDRNYLETTYTHDNLHQLVQETWLDLYSQPIRYLDYNYDAAGNMTSVSDISASLSTNLSATYNYTYDNLGRVTNETAQIAGLTPQVTLASQYDPNSNRSKLSVTIGSTADLINEYQYDGLNRMTRIEQHGDYRWKYRCQRARGPGL